jgi:acyl-CoA thioesterase
MTPDPGRSAFEAAALALHARDSSAQQFGIEIVAVDEGAATVAMTVTAEMCNGHGTCHGGMLFTLADSAFAFACNSYGLETVAAAASIEFLAPARAGQRLVAVCTERWLRGRTGIYDATVSTDDEVVALFRGRSARISTSSQNQNQNPSQPTTEQA